MAGVGQGTSNVTGETNFDPDFPRRMFSTHDSFPGIIPGTMGCRAKSRPVRRNTIVLFTTMAKVIRLNRSPPESIAS